MTLKVRVKQYFTQPPASFVFERDDTKAIRRGAAALQCKTDHQASLVVEMPAHRPDVVQFNTNLLVLLMLVADYHDGDAWLAECMRADPKRQDAEPFMTMHQGKRFELIINRGYGLLTLTVTESVV